MKKIKVKYNASNNPWIRKIVEVEFNSEDLQPIVEKIVEKLKGVSYDTSYHYDKHVIPHVREAFEKQEKYKCNAIPFYYAVQNLFESKIKDYNNWSDPYVVADRCLRSSIAWMTPGFAEAYNNSEG